MFVARFGSWLPGGGVRKENPQLSTYVKKGRGTLKSWGDDYGEGTLASFSSSFRAAN